MSGVRDRSIRGTFAHAPVRGEIDVLRDGVISVGRDGRITSIDQAADGVPDGTIALPAGQLVLPGFVDPPARCWRPAAPLRRPRVCSRRGWTRGDSRETRGVPGSRIDMLSAFHLATSGGGVALDLPVGLFRPGYHFDALLVDPVAEAGTIRLFGADAAERLEQILYTASRPNIAATFVGGDLVSGIDPQVGHSGH